MRNLCSRVVAFFTRPNGSRPGAASVVVFLALFAFLACGMNDSTFSGKVKIKSDDSGKISAVFLVTPGGDKIPLELDDKTRELAEEMEGKQVKASGTLKGDVLTVTSYEEFSVKK